MKNQEKLQQELEALMQLMLDTGLAAREIKTGSSGRVDNRYEHTRFIITDNNRRIRLLVDAHTAQLAAANEDLYTKSNFDSYDVNIMKNCDEIDSANLNRFKKIVKQQIDKYNNENFGVCAYHQAKAALNCGFISISESNAIRRGIESVRNRSRNTEDNIKKLEAALKNLKQQASSANNAAFKLQVSLIFLYIKKFISCCGMRLRGDKVTLASTLDNDEGVTMLRNEISGEKIKAAKTSAVCSSVSLFRKKIRQCVDNQFTPSASRPL